MANLKRGLLMEKLGTMTIKYVKAQIKAGAKAIQIFDSWVGALNVTDYQKYIKPMMHRIFSTLKEENVPLIMYGVGASHLINEWNDFQLMSLVLIGVWKLRKLVH